MILVTLGTQKEQFTRLLDLIENSNIKDKIIVQKGHTKYESKKMQLFDFINYEEMSNLIDKADIIITHGGTGSIITPLKKHKKVIACPRLQKYGEHIDNHQEEVVDIFTELGYILKINEDSNLPDLIKEIKKKEMVPFKSNTEYFLKCLKEEIDK